MKKSILIVAALAAVVAAAVLFLRHRVRRSGAPVAVAAQPRTVLGAALDLRRWSPWCRGNPRDGLVHTFGGPPAGVGASCYWNGKGAAGRMTIVGAHEGTLDLELAERAPRSAERDLVLTVVREGQGVRVSLAMTRESAALPGSKELAERLDAALDDLRDAAEADEQLARSRVERSAVIAAPLETVLQHLAEVRRWAAWSPWGDADPAAHVTYNATRSGRGATAYWRGPNGSGRITILSAGPERVEAELETMQPRDSLVDLEFAFAIENGATKVVASATGGIAAADLEKALSRLGDAIASEAMHATR